jgi:hypothetical protein
MAVKASVTGECFEADYAIVTNKAKAIVVDEVNKIIEADEANVINKIIAVNEIAEVDIHKANVIIEIVSAGKAIAVNRAIAVDRANMANEANKASLAEAN